MTEPVKKNPRRGRVKPGKKGEPATFEEGKSASANKGFDAEKIAEELKLWWVDGAGEKFLLEMGDGRWAEWSEKKVVKRMRTLPGRMIALRPRDGEMVSESDQVILHTMEHRMVDLAMPALAGYPAGLHECNWQKVIIRSSPRLLVPEKGEWPTVGALIDGLLGDDQSPYFHSWAKISCESLYRGGPGNFRPGQACIFAGPADSGKSRIQHQVITGLLGGRSADPGAYMFGRTDFNNSMIGAEHLLMEDPATSTMTKDRVYFGEMIKGIVVNDTSRLHRKREDEITGSPFWRLTISINDDPDKMRVLPMLTPDMKDKLMLFHIHKNPLPMPTTTIEERAAFRAKIAEELPFYLHWLLEEYEIPEKIVGGRFGVKEYHCPQLSMELFDDTPAAELLVLIDAAEFDTPADTRKKLWELPDPANQSGTMNTWRGQAVDLEKLLKGEYPDWSSSVASEAKKIFAHNKGTRLLGRLKEDVADRIAPYRTNKERGWLIARPS